MESHLDEKWASSQGPNGCLEHDIEEDWTAKSGLVRQSITTAPTRSATERKVQPGCQLPVDPHSGAVLRVNR